MALSTANKDIVELRRERVAHLRLKQLSAREIADALATGDFPLLNPDTGEPYTHTTILSDIKALNSRWRKEANIATEKHAARQFAEMQETKRLAWQQNDGDLVIKVIDKEMKLLGTMKQPDGLTININMEIIVKLVEAIEARGESAATIFEEILREIELADVARHQS
jgi:hypothetical protein